MWPSMCMCCGLFAPHNSISNVVVSLTIHDNMYATYTYVRDVSKNMKHVLIRNVEKNETIVEGRANRSSGELELNSFIR